MAKKKLQEKSKKTEVPEVQEKEKKVAKKQFWLSPTYIRGSGVVKGEVDPKDLAAFKALVPKATNVDKYLVDYDPVARALAKRKKKMRERLGFNE